jgi:hypothetical protein
VDLRRVRRWEWLTGLSGVVLFLSLLLPWYGSGGQTATAWQAFTFVDIILTLTALGAIALVVVTATQRTAAITQAMSACLVWVALVAVILVVGRLINVPGVDITLTGGSGDITREWGGFVGALAAIALLVFDWRSMRDKSFPVPMRSHPDRETVPTPAPDGTRRDTR